MKQAKKVLALLLAVALTLALAACGGAASSAAPASTAPAASTPAPADSTAAPADSTAASGGAGAAFHVGIVTSSGVDDGSFGEDCYNGIVDFIGANPGTTENHVNEPDINQVVQAVGDVIADYDAMVMPGFQFNAAGPTAIANPDKIFILVDAYPLDETGAEVELENTYAMMFKEEESGFLAGIAAALETKTGKVAVVNGMAFPSNVNYQFGFECGVAYANANLGASAECVELPSYAGIDTAGNEVGGNYIGDFADQATGKLVGEALLAEGVDIMLVAAGDSGNGVFTAIKEAPEGAFAIGCDVDQYDLGASGDRNIILTSALKVMRPQVAAQLQAAYDGAFTGQNALLGAADGATGIVTEEGRHQMTAETVAALDEAFAAIADGAIQPANYANGFTAEDFPGLTAA